MTSITATTGPDDINYRYCRRASYYDSVVVVVAVTETVSSDTFAYPPPRCRDRWAKDFFFLAYTRNESCTYTRPLKISIENVYIADVTNTIIYIMFCVYIQQIF